MLFGFLRHILIPLLWIKLILQYVGFISEKTIFFINVQKILLPKKCLANKFISFIQIHFINFSSFLALGKRDFSQMVAVDQLASVIIHNALENLSMVSVIPRALSGLWDSCPEFIYFIPLKL